jgi:hypothetical protein
MKAEHIVRLSHDNVCVEVDINRNSVRLIRDSKDYYESEAFILRVLLERAEGLIGRRHDSEDVKFVLTMNDDGDWLDELIIGLEKARESE